MDPRATTRERAEQSGTVRFGAVRCWRAWEQLGRLQCSFLSRLEGSHAQDETPNAKTANDHCHHPTDDSQQQHPPSS